MTTMHDSHHPLPPGTRVTFDIEGGMATGSGVVAEVEYDDGWLYRLDAAEGDGLDLHRNERRELRVWDFEIQSVEVRT